MITYPRNPRVDAARQDERKYGNARFLRKVMKKLQVINRTELAYSRVAAVV